MKIGLVDYALYNIQELTHDKHSENLFSDNSSG